MNKLLLATLILVFSSCTQQTIETKKTEYYIRGSINPIELTIIDSCEYFLGDWGNATVLTHKGNCKFCKQRNK